MTYVKGAGAPYYSHEKALHLWRARYTHNNVSRKVIIMFDYLRYYLGPAVQICAAIGICIGGIFAWTGVSTLLLFAVIDAIFPRDTKVRNIRNEQFALIPVWIGALFSVGLYLVLAWQIGKGDMSVMAMIGGTLSASWLGVIIGVPTTHELYHKQGTLKKLIGTYSQVIYLDATRNIAHMVGHHLDVGTPEDCDTAERGKTLYTFAPAAVYESTKTAWRLESEALMKRGYSRWSIHHQLWKGLLALVVFAAVLYLLGGLTGMLFCLAGASLARLWVETFNYFQHYGQVRVPGKPISRRHVWNHLHPISRVVAFEITNHADHHLDAYIPFYRLKPDASAVNVPNVFVCFLAALIPPIWHRFIIMPALKDWDLNYASAEERELAREQNRRAGWPDWFESADQDTQHAGLSGA